MGVDKNIRRFHESSQTHRISRILHKNQKCTGERPVAAVQLQPVADRSHGKFAHPVAHMLSIRRAVPAGIIRSG